MLFHCPAWGKFGWIMSGLVCLEYRCRSLSNLVFQYLGLDDNQLPCVRKNSLDKNFHRGFGNSDQLEHGIIGLPDNLLLFVERRRKDGVVDVLVEFQHHVFDRSQREMDVFIPQYACKVQPVITKYFGFS